MDVKKKKEQAPKKKENISKTKTTHKYWIGGYIFLALISLAAYFLFRLKVFQTLGTYLPLAKKISLACFFAFIILITGRVAEKLIVKRSRIKYVSYNLVRVIRLLVVLLIIIVLVSFLFENWYTAAVSLGLISLILGFALQTPISSFIAWLYIIFRSPYRIGDRIQTSSPVM